MAVSGARQGEMPESFATPAFSEFSPTPESGSKAGLTTEMTTGRKVFDFLLRCGIIVKIEYPGVAQLVAHLLWEQDAAGSNPVTRATFLGKTALLGGFSALKVLIPERT